MTDPSLPRSAEALERRAPVQGFSAGIPWEMHLRAYDGYCKRHGPQQALIEGWCRGGFGMNELDEYIPGWRDELSERAAMKARIAELEAALRLSPPPETWRPISEDQFAHACQVALEYGTPAGHATLLDYMKSPRPAEGEEPRR